MELAIYAHPFDLQALAAQGGLARLAELGFAEVALATAYHDGRWLTPWHPAGRVRFLEDGTVHFRPGSGYGALRPQPSSLVPATGPDPLDCALAEARAAGVRLRAWTVFHHNSRLGDLHPECTVENAYGDRYRYALCPAQPAVQAYSLQLAAELAARPGLAGIELEALGWLGHKHSSHHDKSSFTARGFVEVALSLCHCPACAAAVVAAGGDPGAVRAHARRIVQAAIDDGDAMAALQEPDPAAAAAGFAPLAAARTSLVQGLQRRLRSRCAVARLALQVHPSPWFTGSQLPLAQVAAEAIDELVVTAYGEELAAIERTLAALGPATTPRRLSVWPKAPQFTSDEDLGKLRTIAERHGVTTLAIYHLGLLPWRTVERVARQLTA